jgi:hypothetical protein
MRQQINKVNHAINDYNRAANNYNRQVKQAVNKYNQAVRQHNTKVRQNRSRIEAELRQLNSSSSRISTTYSTSVATVHSTYQRVAATYDTMEYGTQFQEYIYAGIEQENANNLAAANVVLDNAEPMEPEYSLQDTQIMDRLTSISQDLDNRWKGALFSLNPINPDATRHFCTSAREIFTEIFDTRATDKDVFSVMPDCEKTDYGNATRRSKVKFFLHRKGLDDSDVESFIDSDIANVLELFSTLSAGTHGSAGKYTISQLAVIKKRVEDGLIFLCDIAK